MIKPTDPIQPVKNPTAIIGQAALKCADARNAGRRAAVESKSKEKNPFHEAALEHRAWLEGFETRV